MTIVGLDGAEIVQLRDSPMVNDIPNMLRKLADSIEGGEQEATFAFVVVNGSRYAPTCFGFGDGMDTRSIIGMLDLAISQRRASLFEDDERDNANGKTDE